MPSIPVQLMTLLRELPLFSQPSAPPPTLPILLAQMEMQSSNKLPGQEEFGKNSIRCERCKARFAPYPPGPNKSNNKGISAESESDSPSDLYLIVIRRVMTSSLSQRVRPVVLVVADITLKKPSGGLEKNIGDSRYMSRNLSKIILNQIRIFLLNLSLLFPLSDIWPLRSFQACVVMLVVGLSLIWCAWSSNIDEPGFKS